MSATDDFEFLNSRIWLEYTQARYLSIKDIKYRLDKSAHSQKNWNELKVKIQKFRKLGSVPFFLESINKKFWYYPADCITRKIDEIEWLGNKLYEKIHNHREFKSEFIANSAIEEAITSAIYEGANSTRAKAKQLIATSQKPKNKDEWMLINNYIAMGWVKKNQASSLNHELILKLHEIVTKNTLEGDDANFSGKYRDDKVFVGPHEGINHRKIKTAMDEAIKLTTENKRYIHGLLKGILLHYFIGYIHPFFDGNGRTARTLFYFKAMKNDLNFVELLSVSAQLKEHGKKYEKAFENVLDNDLDITYFVDFCLDSLNKALSNVERKVTYLMDVSKLSTTLSLNQSQIGLIQRMALNKFRSITIDEYSEMIKKSREIARRELKYLLSKNLVREKKEGKKFCYYIESKMVKELVADIKVKK